MWPVTQTHNGPISQLGRYEVIATIGSGGMATIFLSKIAGPAGFEKAIALKVIHSHLAEDPHFIQMFLDEARLAAYLQHPNIVQIFELGEADSVYYIAMEYLRGETLGAVIQKVFGEEGRRMDPRMACHIIQAASEGLHYAHEMTDIDDEPLGIIHRDVSPQNLFVTYSGSVKLMDFGIARAEGAAHSTQPGSLKGKFSYMSPEQVGGKPIDRRSDIFALGVVFWEMLTGRRLFKGRSELDSLRLVGECAVPPPGSMRPGIPPSLDRVVAQALAKDPDHRYQTAMELHSDIGLVMDQLGSPVTTHELSGRMKRWFVTEAAKKRKLLSRTLQDVKVSEVGANDGMMTEGTPSVSEPSGIRVRDADILRVETDQGTPSNSSGWSVGPAPNPLPTPFKPPVAPPPTVPSTSASELLDFDDDDEFEPDNSLADPVSDPRGTTETGELSDKRLSSLQGRGSKIWIVLSGLFGLFGVLVLVSVLLLPWLGFDLFSLGQLPPSSGRPAIDPRLISSDRMVDEDTPFAPAISDQTLPTPGEDTPTIEVQTDDPGASALGVSAAADTTGPPAPPETVTLTLRVRPSRARVTVDGEVSDDPENIVLPRSADPVAIVISAPSYERAVLSIVPDQDIERSLSLRRLRDTSSDEPASDNSGDLVSNPYRRP